MKILIQTQSGRTIRLRVWNRLLLNGVAAQALAHAVCSGENPARGHHGPRASGPAGGTRPGGAGADRIKRQERRETARLFRRFFRRTRSLAPAVRGAGDTPLVEVKRQNGVQVTVVL